MTNTIVRDKYAAAFLMCRGRRLIDMTPAGHTFAGDCYADLRDYRHGAPVEAKSFVAALKSLSPGLPALFGMKSCAVLAQDEPIDAR